MFGDIPYDEALERHLANPQCGQSGRLAVMQFVCQSHEVRALTEVARAASMQRGYSCARSVRKTDTYPPRRKTLNTQATFQRGRRIRDVPRLLRQDFSPKLDSDRARHIGCQTDSASPERSPNISFCHISN
jgi:hypothetical protein